MHPRTYYLVKKRERYELKCKLLLEIIDVPDLIYRSTNSLTEFNVFRLVVKLIEMSIILPIHNLKPKDWS